MDQPLDVTVRAILASRRGEWPAIAKDASVSYSWLSKFVNGHIPNPGLATLNKVYEVVGRRSTDRKAGEPANG